MSNFLVCVEAVILFFDYLNYKIKIIENLDEVFEEETYINFELSTRK